MNSSQKLGKWGEDAAANYLLLNGYEILNRNWRSPYGEIDLIVSKNGELIFVEVKTRSGTEMGYPEESVTLVKQEHLINSCNEFLTQNIEYGESPWQIDVIAILKTGNPRQPIEIFHIENAVEG